MKAIDAALAAAERLGRPAIRALNAVISYEPETLLEQARRVDAAPSRTALTGCVIAVKDNICTLDYPTTCASRMLAGYQSPYEATAVTRLKAAGALIACKTNLDEFAMGSSTEHSAFGRTVHPERAALVPGGSSGGSAALTAAGVVDAALGSETGGSVRQPAAFCGVVGVNPTYGLVSRHGLVAFGSSLDQIGVLAPTVDVATRVLAAISGRDERDATCADRDPLQLAAPPPDLSAFTIGVPHEYFPPEIDPGVARACKRSLDRLRGAGATLRDVSLPHTALALAAYYVLAPAEASSNLARYDGVRFGRRETVPGDDVHAMYRATRGAGFGPEVRRRILVGTYVLSAGYYEAFYRRALAARAAIARDFSSVFENGVDFVFGPTTPTTAFEAGTRVDDPVEMYRADRFVCPTNLAGLPAVSLPVGRAEGLPVGAQLIARRFGERGLLSAAAVVERLVDPQSEVA